jgi:ankyrin repeat protein
MIKNKYTFVIIALLAQALQLHGMDVDQASIDLLQAVHDNNIEGVQAAIAAGANINWQDANKDAALIIATMNNRDDIVTTLVNAGADLNLQDNEGQSALMWAETSAPGVFEAFLTAIIDANRSQDFNEHEKELLHDQYNQFENIDYKTEEEENIFAALETILQAILNPGLATLW